MRRPEPSRGDGRSLKAISAPGGTAVIEAPVWTDAIPSSEERRAYAREEISLPLRLKRVAGQRESKRLPLRTVNISLSGVLFLCPRHIEPGTPVEVEVCLLERPAGGGTVRMTTEAHVVRSEPAQRPGWHALALSFDEIRYDRDAAPGRRFQERH